MARARNIKPGFFKNEDLAECSPWARLCFAGLWTLADREGRLEDRPKRIKGELFAFDTIDVEPLLKELERFKFIVRYETDGMKAIQISEFARHQSPHYSEIASVIKPPSLPESTEKETPIKTGSQPPDSLIPDSLIPDSLIPDSLIPDSLIAKTLVAPAAPKRPPPAFDGKNGEALNGKAVVAIADAWELPEQWGMDAEALGFKPASVLNEAEKFRQYYVSGKGAGKRRNVKGWRQSWSNWLGKAAERQR
jgi:hypothetical protein